MRYYLLMLLACCSCGKDEPKYKYKSMEERREENRKHELKVQELMDKVANPTDNLSRYKQMQAVKVRKWLEIEEKRLGIKR